MIVFEGQEIKSLIFLILRMLHQCMKEFFSNSFPLMLRIYIDLYNLDLMIDSFTLIVALCQEIAEDLLISVSFHQEESIKLFCMLVISLPSFELILVVDTCKIVCCDNSMIVLLPALGIDQDNRF